MPPFSSDHLGRSTFALLLLLLSIAKSGNCQPTANHDHEASESSHAATLTPNQAANELIETQPPFTLATNEQEQRAQAADQGAHAVDHQALNGGATEEARDVDSKTASAHESQLNQPLEHETHEHANTPTTTSSTTTTPEPSSTPRPTPTQPNPDAASGAQPTSASTSLSASVLSSTSSATEEPECDNLCLNGGRCVVLETGEMVCECVAPFFGSRCQHRDICKSIIADNLSGDQVCERIGRTCLQDDKLFRCACDKDQFFVFKADYQPPPASPYSTVEQSRLTGAHNSRKQTSTFAYDSLLPLQAPPSSNRFADNEQQLLTKSNTFSASTTTTSSSNSNNNNNNNNNKLNGNNKKHYAEEQANKVTYLAECRNIDKCLGLRCRQTSEVCQEGVCVCNRNAGYIQDPLDKLCKLLDPCQMASPDGLPICGQAKCVATYDRELYKCVCPIGYKPIKVGEHRSSIQCALLTNQLCDIPLLNKCQHLCKIDRKANTYKCSCLPGYKPGLRTGIDDHMCFFDEHLGESSGDEADDYTTARIIDHIKSDERPSHRWRSEQQAGSTDDSLITYDPKPETNAAAASYRFRPVKSEEEGELKSRVKLTIKRELVPDEGAVTTPSSGRFSPARSAKASFGADNGNSDLDDFDYDRYGDLNSMSAQDRCNMYCEPNKICVLEEGSHDSYRCVCERQGYVSVGDKCLDWCSAAEFSHGVQSLLAEVCYSGICKQADARPPSPTTAGGFYLQHQLDKVSTPIDGERLLASAKSSWRPTFECDCSTSPLMFKDPETKLCKLDFEAILRPCLPGNEGYTDCVVNKHSYCSVLHRPTHFFFRDLFAEQIFENQLKAAASATATSDANSSAAPSSEQQQQQQQQQQKSAPNKKLRPKEKLYTCVCSPEKKFLVDKPRNKARCIDECDLLNNECGRFNRMCRPATIESNQDFGFNWNLVKFDRDGVRMNQFKRTGCECLPGFNVGPTEARDFTLDDNYPDTNGHFGSSGSSSVWPSPEALALSEQASRWQVMDAYEIFQEPALSGDINALLSADFAGPEFEHLRTKYININSRCLLDYDVVEFHASFKAPAAFEPSWIKVKNTKPLISSATASSSSQAKQSASASANLSNNQADLEAAKEESPDGAKSSGRDAAAKRPEVLKIPSFMRADIAEFHKHAVLVAQCDSSLAQLSFEAYRKCLRYRYWVVQKLRRHFADWRRVISRNLKETFDLMDGNIRFRVNKCEATIKRIATIPGAFSQALDKSGEFADLATMRGAIDQQQSSVHGEQSQQQQQQQQQQAQNGDRKQDSKTTTVGGEQLHEMIATEFDPLDPFAKIDADLDCELTIHSASDDSGSRRHARKVLLEKQLPKFIFNSRKLARDDTFQRLFGDASSSTASSSSWPRKSSETQMLKQDDAPNEPPDPDYYLMAPNTLIQRDSFDQLGQHRKLFSPCKSDYAYCDKQTRCEMVDTVNYSCTCDYGYTPIGSRDIYFGDSRKEVCEDINECLFDVCKENGLENKSICVNEIGDYKCQCTRHHVGDNKRYCNHICNVIACKYGDCRIPDEHHAFCECHEGYREADCSVLDPSVALRKANMIICGSIFTSVLLLAVTLAISLNSQLKKTKKKLKRLEAAQDAAEFLEFNLQQAPFTRQRVSKASIAS